MIETGNTKLLVEMVASQGVIFSYNCSDCNNIPNEYKSHVLWWKKEARAFLRPIRNKEKNNTKWKDFIISKSISLKIWQSGCSYGLQMSGYIGGSQWQPKALFGGIIGVKCLRCWKEKLWWEKQTCQRGWRPMSQN